jgi:penicillin-binding protein 1A
MRLKRLILYAIGATALFAVLTVGGLYVYTALAVPMNTLKDYHPSSTTKVYSDDGLVIGEFYNERRTVVPFSEIPEHLVYAFLAAEDSKFFRHEGIDYLGIMRALYKNVQAGKVVQGASTITQQVAKSFFLTPERTLTRKIREALMATRIERNLTKEEILYLYLNQIYFGNGAYGVQSAAETYFGKNASELTLAESALLAGLPKAPSRYSPYVNPADAVKRQQFVLRRMVEEGFLEQHAADLASTEPLKLKPKMTESLWVGPYFTEHVRRHLEEFYGSDLLYKGGLHVYTTLNINMQKAANSAVREGLLSHDRRRGYRGTLSAIRGLSDIAAFKAEAEKALMEKPPAPGNVYRALIVSADPRGRSFEVDMGGRRGVLNSAEMSWAAQYAPKGKGVRLVKLSEIFTPGSVIEVEVVSVPEDDKSPLRVSLYQEPLAEGALLAIEPATGFVKAMVGGYDFSRSEFNRAVQASRQPGSAFKPVIYASALDKGYTPASIVIDSPLVFKSTVTVEDAEARDREVTRSWTPRNFEEKFHGPTTIREALTMSRNVVTIKVLQDVGVEHAIDYARRLGIESPLANDLSLALGSSSVTLMELTRAFSTVANLGMRTEPTFVLRITDNDGKVLEEAVPKAEETISPQTAYVLTSLLQGVVERGTGWRAKALGRPVAAKTGTTNNMNDAWFMGYVPGLAAGTWIGYDEERPLGPGETGSTAAAPIWVKFMKEVLRDAPVENFQTPDGVEFAKIDPATGLLAGPATEKPIFEVFRVGTKPTEVSTGKGPSKPNDFFIMDAGEGPAGPAIKADEGDDALPDERAGGN